MSFRSNRSGILTVTFAGGVTAYTRVIQVRQTYAGLLIGSPSYESNRRHIRGLPRTVRRVLGFGPVIVIPAEEDRLVREPKQHSPETEIEAWLPEFEIWARFEADIAKNPEMDGSCLSLVWHQIEPHPFIAPAVLNQVQTIRWRDVAMDFEA